MPAPRRRYPTDLTDAEWQVLTPLIPPPKPGGRPAVHDRRELVDAMLYWLRSGCAWRLLPHDFPPWQTVYHYWRAWRQQDLWEQQPTVSISPVSPRDPIRVRCAAAGAGWPFGVGRTSGSRLVG